MTQKEAQAAILKYGSQNKAAAALKVSRWAIQHAVQGGRYANGRNSRAVTAACCTPLHAAPARKLSDFRAAYDKNFIVPKRIQEGLRKLGASGWEYEVQFAKNIGVSLTDMSTFREKFAEYVVQIARDGRRAWAGSVKTAVTMKEMVS